MCGYLADKTAARHGVCTVIQRSSVKRNSARCRPCRRSGPMPLPLTPPKGICASSCTVGPLTWQMPESMRRATRRRARCRAEHRGGQAVLVVVGAGDGLLDAVDPHDALHRAERSPRGRCASRGVTWSSTVAGMSVLSALPPHNSRRPWPARRRSARCSARPCGMPITSPARRARACAGRPGAAQRPWQANFFTKSSATFWSTMMRSVLMQIWPCWRRRRRRAVDRGVEVGVVQHHQRRLAAELQHHRLEVPGAGHRR
jgi:hypothetical protein